MWWPIGIGIMLWIVNEIDQQLLMDFNMFLNKAIIAAVNSFPDAEAWT